MARPRRDHQADPHDHAEESALRKVPAGDPRLPTATVYSSLKPCSVRLSRPVSCARLILAAGIRRVVFAWREPEVFVDGKGVEVLHSAQAEVIDVSKPESTDAGILGGLGAGGPVKRGLGGGLSASSGSRVGRSATIARVRAARWPRSGTLTLTRAGLGVALCGRSGQVA
jgi:tRNA(Arg) A34 adenosine deaminase TadA